ncbi:MAG: ADP-forming succinate--CoA ligase subunit beta [Promethearchaeota archaeon]
MVRLYEYEAKEILKNYDILIPEGYLIRSISELEQKINQIDPPIMLKAQILVGGRGKAGGIKSATSYEEALKAADMLFNNKIKDNEVKSIYIEKKINIKNEFYIGITVDRLNRNYIIIFSADGGVEIEQLAKTDPNKILKINFEHKDFISLDLKSNFHSLNFSTEIVSKIEKIFQEIWNILNDYDLDLIEINPCILSMDDRLYAADVRMNIDENSVFRHQEFVQRSREGLTQAEIEVKEKGMSYVELDGNIGIICNGAGLVMSTIDTVRYYGGSPANFLDIGGGATRERILFALKVISSNPKIKGILINIIGGITRCDEIAYGIIEFLKGKKDVAMAIRLVGTKEKEGRELLAKHEIPMLETMEDAIKNIIKLVS